MCMKSLDDFKYLRSKFINSRLGGIIFLQNCYALFVLSITVNVYHKIIPIKTSMVYLKYSFLKKHCTLIYISTLYTFSSCEH